jgi:M6 family metalloprotease-like protein
MFSAEDIQAHSIPDPSPAFGDQKVLVILVDFSDEPGQVTQQSFFNQFFGSFPTGSFSDYYREVSYGQLRYSGDVVGIRQGVVVENSPSATYVRMPHAKAYYSFGSGGSTVASFPRNVAGLFLHAVQALDAAGFSFSKYADENKIVRNAIVIFSGRPAGETKNADDLNPQHYSIEYVTSGGYRAKDGTLLKTFSTCPERGAHGQAPIGLCTHEQGHALGLPDLYDHAYKKTVNGYFDLMAAGTFGGNGGERPFHLSAFSKMKLGWLQPRTVNPDQYSTTLSPVETSPSALKLSLTEDSKEYFLVENRQPLGFDDLWQSYRGMCPGLVIWRIQEEVYSRYLLDG